MVRLTAVALALVIPVAVWAGVESVPPTLPVGAPAVGEPGLIVLGLGLVGAGIAMLKRR